MSVEVAYVEGLVTGGALGIVFSWAFQMALPFALQRWATILRRSSNGR